MRALAVVHQPDAGSGVFAEAAADRGLRLEEWSPANGGAPPAPAELDAVLVFGGAMHVDQEDAHPWLREEKRWLRELLERGVPTLGVCLGAQLVAEAAGARVGRAARPEIGWHEVALAPEAREDPVLGSLPERFAAFEWHSYEFALPPGATPLASNRACLQAFRIGDAAWGVQFHAEVTRDIARGWLADYAKGEDAARLRLDPTAVTAETERRIEGWNRLGRELSGRFLDAAARRAGRAAA